MGENLIGLCQRKRVGGLCTGKGEEHGRAYSVHEYVGVGGSGPGCVTYWLFAIGRFI